MSGDHMDNRQNTNTRRLSFSRTTGKGLYDILGIPKTATNDEIKRAYRELALKFHPDQNSEDPNAAERFKEINKANCVLMDERKRRIYDKYGSFGLNVASQVGDDKADFFLKFENPCVKVLLVLFFLFTGCFYCCCCFCFCFCKFCCGKCAPKDELDAEAGFDDLEVAPFLSSQALTKDIISDLQVLKSLVNNVKEDWEAMSRIKRTSEHLANEEQRFMFDKAHRGLLTYLDGVDAIRKSIAEKVTKIKKNRELVLMNAEMYSQDQLDGLQDVILSLQDLEYKFSKYREDCESVYKTLVDETGQCTALMSMTWFNVFWINVSISEIESFF